MKLILTETLKTRLKNTAFNGSKIAKDILKEINKNVDVSEIIKGKYNYFGTKIYKSANGSEVHYQEIVVTCCNKDLNNQNFPDFGNPNAPWKKRNRTEIASTTFLGLFRNLPTYTSEEIQFFESAIAINSKIVLRKLDKEVGFQLAYDGVHYTRVTQKRESTLWNSCMRGEPYCDIAADFYGNLCKAKVIVAQDMDGYTYGRAIIWENLETERYGKVSLLDRIYFSHDFVYKMIQHYAERTGVTFRKARNTYDSQAWVHNMNHPDIEKDQELEVHVYKELKLSKWYRQGIPYVDTLDRLILRGGKTYLTNNSSSSPLLVDLKTTSGYNNPNRWVCPVCGQVNDNYEHRNKVCNDCKRKYTKQTDFGPVWERDLVKYRGENVPALCLRDGKPKRGLRNWTILKLVTTDGRQ